MGHFRLPKPFFSHTLLSPHKYKRSLRLYAILFAFIALRAVGNLALAWRTRHFSESLALDPFSSLRAMLNPYIGSGIAMLMLSLLTRLALLSVADLSFVLPMTAVGYIVSVVLGRVFLGEEVSTLRWLGVLLIFAAVGLVGTTPTSTTPVGYTEPSSSGKEDYLS